MSSLVQVGNTVTYSETAAVKRNTAGPLTLHYKMTHKTPAIWGNIAEPLCYHWPQNGRTHLTPFCFPRWMRDEKWKCLHATVFAWSEMIQRKCSCLVFVSLIEEERNDQIALKFKNLMEWLRISVIWSFSNLLFLPHTTILMLLHYLPYFSLFLTSIQEYWILTDPFSVFC